MKVAYECVPCIVRQSTEACRLITEDKDIQKKVIKHTLKELSNLDFTETAPYLGRIIHKYIKEITGIADPYSELKEKYNAIAQKLVEDLNLRKLIEDSKDNFDSACRVSIAGNIIDFSVKMLVDETEVKEVLDICLQTGIYGESSQGLLESARKAKKILFIADNAGEIVFDKFLVELLPREKVTYVVKGGPIVNDAIMKDAVSCGMTDLVPVIDTGIDYQGIVLSESSQEFIQEFSSADLIISKGQANYETLSEITDKEIFFLLKAKCKSIADHIGCGHGDFVLKRNIPN